MFPRNIHTTIFEACMFPRNIHTHNLEVRMFPRKIHTSVFEVRMFPRNIHTSTFKVRVFPTGTYTPLLSRYVCFPRNIHVLTRSFPGKEHTYRYFRGMCVSLGTYILPVSQEHTCLYFRGTYMFPREHTYRYFRGMYVSLGTYILPVSQEHTYLYFRGTYVSKGTYIRLFSRYVCFSRIIHTPGFPGTYIPLLSRYVCFQGNLHTSIFEVCMFLWEHTYFYFRGMYVSLDTCIHTCMHTSQGGLRQWIHTTNILTSQKQGMYVTPLGFLLVSSHTHEGWFFHFMHYIYIYVCVHLPAYRDMIVHAELLQRAESSLALHKAPI